MKSKQLLILVIVIMCFCIASMGAAGVFATSGEETPSTGAGDASDDAAGADASSSKYRYVKVYRDKDPDDDDHWMNMAEVEVFSGGVNVSRDKTVTQSSIFNDKDFPPKFLVDGDKTNSAHTNNDQLEWFLIDLGENYDIEKVVITNRHDCCQNRLRNTKIQLSKTADGTDAKESRAITADESMNTAIIWDVKTDKVSVSGIKLHRFVKVYRNKDEDNGNHWMNLAEVEVFSGGVNIAKGKTVTQSSIYHTTAFPPSFLVDEIKTNFAHTNNDQVEWFLIDLGGNFEIEKVIVSNRQDCCKPRLRHTKIQLSTAMVGTDLIDYIESREITTDEAVKDEITWDVKTDKISAL